MKSKPIKRRIIDALNDHGEGGFLPYHELAHLVFPRDAYPRAFQYPTKGGPPGCYMVLSRAIREHEFSISLDGGAVVYATVGLGRNRATANEDA